MDAIRNKVGEIIEELKKQQLWKRSAPEWVSDYATMSVITEEDFRNWLQFVWLPNLLQEKSRPEMVNQKNIVPQAIRFFGEDVKKGKLLQLLIELDALR